MPNVKNLNVEVPESLYKEAKLFCVSRDIFLKDFIEASLLVALRAQGSEQGAPECDHSKGLCWGVCGLDPKKVWHKHNPRDVGPF